MIQPCQIVHIYIYPLPPTPPPHVPCLSTTYVLLHTTALYHKIIYLLSEFRILLQKLHHAVSQLSLVLGQSLSLVEWDEDPVKKLLVLRFEGQGKTVNNAPQNLQEFSHTVKLLRLINKSEMCISTTVK